MTDLLNSFNEIISGLHSLQQNLMIEFNTINTRLSYLEDEKEKDNKFYDDLEALIQRRKNL